MNTLYGQILKIAMKDKLVVSGMKYFSDLGLLKAIVNNPVTPGVLAKKLKMKERYVLELSLALAASRVIQLNNNLEISITGDNFKEFQHAITNAPWEPHFQKTIPFLNECFKEGGKMGYTFDESPYMLEYAYDLRSPFKPTIVKKLIDLMKTFHPSGNIKYILDIGCGTGEITIPLAQQLLGVTVVGGDPSVKAISTASKDSKGIPNLSFVKIDDEAHPKDWSKKFDVILMFDLLHDLPHPEKTMKQIMQGLNDKGILIIVDPDVSSDPMEIIGNMQSANALMFSTSYCLLSSCCSHDSSALGVSWGTGRKQKFLEGMGLVVKHRVSIGSDFNHAFICVKKT